MQIFGTLSELPDVGGGIQLEIPNIKRENSKSVSSRWHQRSNEVSFFGLTLNPMSSERLTAVVEQGVEESRKWIITNHNLHSVYLFHRRPLLREFYKKASWTFIDGMPLVALGRLYGYALRREQRVTLADWLHPLMKLAAQKEWRVFNLGSQSGVAEKGAAELRRLYPGLQIEVCHGYFDARPGSAENEAVVQRIQAYQPDLLMVGMGMPRQEIWTLENFVQLKAGVILASNGAAIDYVAGAVGTPPRWAGPLGMEWAFRFMNEPSRLFGRYLIEPWYLLILLIKEVFRKKDGSTEPSLN